MLTPSFKRLQANILRCYGAHGAQWLKDLPCKIRELAKHWSLTCIEPLSNLSYHYVFGALQQNRPVIVKMGLDTSTLQAEFLALKTFESYGTIQALDSFQGALLLERALPGESVKSLFPHRDTEALKIASSLINALHQCPIPQESSFPSLTQWFAAIGTNLDIDPIYLNQARHVKNLLLGSPFSPPVLLHGDLHHDNILRHQNTWKIIDPKGVIGDPMYELAAFILTIPSQRCLPCQIP